jgi:hypothetical protein
MINLRFTLLLATLFPEAGTRGGVSGGTLRKFNLYNDLTEPQEQQNYLLLNYITLKRTVSRDCAQDEAI